MKKKLIKHKNSANELYDVYTSKQNLHEYKNGYKITEGIFDLATYEDCFWLLDLIFLFQEYIVYHSDLQSWELNRIDGNSFTLSWINDKNEVIFENNDMNISFYFDYVRIIKKGNLLCLPIEQELY